MIFVTLGTQDKNFKRILEDIEREIYNKNINDEVYVQAGFTKYNSKKMKIFDLLDKEQFDKYIKECDLLITHGGVGSILTGLKNGKKIIVCPRLSKYHEHINDHQVQITENFSKMGYIIAYNEGDNLSEKINDAMNFKPKKYISNTDKMIKIINKFIKDN